MDNQLEPPSEQKFLPGRISLIISAWLPVYIVVALTLLSLTSGSKVMSSAVINSLFPVFLFGTPIVAAIGIIFGILGLIMRQEARWVALLGIGLNALLFVGSSCLAMIAGA